MTGGWRTVLWGGVLVGFVGACNTCNQSTTDAGVLVAECGPGITRVASDAGSRGCADVTKIDMARFFHLSEGSDLIPLSWLKSLENSSTHKPFMEDLARFGLLPDAASKEGLPIGMSLGKPIDLNFVGATMVGFNCAACHVGQLKTGDAPIVGAPNLFDIKAFYEELFKSAEATVTSLPTLYKFVRAVIAFDSAATESTVGPSEHLELMGATERDFLKSSSSPRKDLQAFSSSLTEFSDLGTAGAAPADLNRRLSNIYKDEMARDPDEPRELFRAANVAVKDQKLVDLPSEKLSSLLVEKHLTTSADHGFPERFLGILRLLRSRMELLKTVAFGAKTSVVAGPGRVDAFGTARNFVFPTMQQPTDAPINYPLLWDFGNRHWLHWDANTDSIMERNIGQAIGLGAIVVPATGESTVLVRNIHELECMARLIPPPTWTFGSTNPMLVKKGRELYDSHCKMCHEHGDPEFDYRCINTDPNRAISFARPLGSSTFAKQLEAVLSKTEQAAFTREQVPPATASEWAGASDWEATSRYPARPLRGIWASAPYLHNGSVPTIWDLLSSRRPSSFKLGLRNYDAGKLGYDTTNGTFTFDTAIAGNHNTGHLGAEYGTDLGEEDKHALIEYLKTL